MSDKLEEVQEVHNPDTDRARYVWAVKGERGGVHVWAQSMCDEAAKISGSRYYGGIEVHRATPHEYDNPAEPSHDECWLIGKPCWHDGSSLQFSEQVLPMIERMGVEAVASYCLSIARAWYRDCLEAKP
jgi:hypothetical protein